MQGPYTYANNIYHNQCTFLGCIWVFLNNQKTNSIVQLTHWANLLDTKPHFTNGLKKQCLVEVFLNILSVNAW